MSSRSFAAALLVLVCSSAPLAAQRGGAMRNELGAGPPGARPPRAALMRDIQQAFMRNAAREMNLTEDQRARFERVVLSWAQKRDALELEDRRLRQSLNGQLRPGVAANSDSVTRDVDALNDNRVAYAESLRDEMRDLKPVLDPVQRGQFQMRRDQLLQKVRELQQARPPNGASADSLHEP